MMLLLLNNEKLASLVADIIIKDKQKDRDRWEKKFKKITTAGEKKFKKVMSSYFKDQKKEAIKEVKKRIKKHYGLSVFIKVNTTGFDFSGWTFNNNEWNDRLINEGSDFIKEMYDLIGTAVFEEIQYQIGDFTASFDLLDEDVLDFIDSYIYSFAVTVNETTTALLQDGLSEALSVGQEEGLSMNQIATELTNTVGDLFDYWSDERALLIARTETIRASNAGALEGYRKSGVVSGKEWLCTDDDRTCFPANTKIKVKFGFKNIQDIKLGMKVLTHRDRYRKVVEVSRKSYIGDFVQIYFYNKNKKRITCTNDHPILVNGEWKRADQIKQGDKLSIIAKKCPICGVLMPFKRNYCSGSCASINANASIWSDPKQHERVSRQNHIFGKGKMLKKLHEHRMRTDSKYRKRFCLSGSLAHKLYFSIPENYERMVQQNRKTAEHPDWGWRNKERLEEALKAAHRAIGRNHLGKTFLEKKIEWWLNKEGINYEPQKYFNNGDRRFWVDFYLPDYNLIVEADGEFWHKKKSDVKERDNELKKVFTGQILHFKGNDILNNFGYCEKLIETAIASQNCFIEVDVIKTRKWTVGRVQPVYNLTVEEDHSYTANGIVVHNCPECLAMDGTVISLDENFDEGDDPDDPYNDTPHPPLHCNCRCTLIPIIDESLLDS